MLAGGLSIHVAIEPPEMLVRDASIFVASPDLIEGWLRRAKSSDMCVYARAARLDRDMAGAILVRQLAQRGLVTLRQQPQGRGLFDYIARRTVMRLVVPVPAAPQRADALAPETQLVLDHLARQADQGAPCPSSRGIARACGLKDAEAARYQLRKLREAGAIIVVPVPVDPGRVVTIVETGARTGLIGRGQ